MNSFLKASALVAAGVTLSSVASAAEILVTSDITSSTTWTAGNTYNLQGQIYVRSGATLTIQPGVIVASTAGLGGSLAVATGSQIFVNGTATDPVIMTSTADVATWTAGDPKTGIWRPVSQEWGNLTIMGEAYISENNQPPGTPANVDFPDAGNQAVMEGLTPPPAPVPANVIYYGGGDDNDDSGSISYLSLRYGGKVVGLGNELNGMSLGGIGRGTDMNFIEIMNNVDDGIEIWGGTVNIKNVSIWNIGDDSFDLDQGWRGKAQFGLIVQGYSGDESQGSGVGDNIFEIDGAESATWQPVTTATIYNFTCIGQPQDGDFGIEMKDNARVQFRNMIFMDVGAAVITEGSGYTGTNFTDNFTTPFNVYPTLPMGFTPSAFYAAQTSGTLSELSDSVFFGNNDYTTFNALGLGTGHDNVVEPGTMPIASITRGPARTRGGKVMEPVIALNPLAAGDAVTSVAAAPADGFFTSAMYRGAFDSTNNWLLGWTAADAFDFCGPAAEVSIVNSPNNVQDALTMPLPNIGGNLQFNVEVPPASPCNAGVGSVVLVFATLNGNPFPAFPLGQYGCGGGSGDLLVTPTFNGGTLSALYLGLTSFPIPLQPDFGLCGFQGAAQCAFFNGPGDIEAGNAVYFTIGS